MIRIRRSSERGHAEHGWLETYYTFSFADYFDPEYVQFGPLRHRKCLGGPTAMSLLTALLPGS